MASTSTPSDIPHTVPLPGGIPETHTTHTESTTTILVPKANTAFLNPVQQYNRDLSIAAIRAWNEMRKEEAEGRWRKRLDAAPEVAARKKEKARKRKEARAALVGEGEEGGINAQAGEGSGGVGGEEGKESVQEPLAGPSVPPEFRAQQITILEALSATGLRSIRYAKEIPDVKYVLANDISPSACEAMRTNVAFNGVGHNVKRPAGASTGPWGETREEEEMAGSVAPTAEEDEAEMRKVGRRAECRGRVIVNEGDALTLMYARRGPTARVDVVDLDPYGTAAPFVDAAIGCIADGGLLAVTCTDLAVLAGSQYPEKSFSNYGGTSVNAEYSHEVALRLVIASLATSAARYGRYITPLLCLSIDFYVRLFVRVDTQPLKVKSLMSQIGVVYVCSYCQSPTPQPFGRIVDKENKAGKTTRLYRTAQGPPTGGSGCEHCGGTQHLGGPMWLGPIQDPEFAERVLKSTAGQEEDYKTWARIQGMVTLAKDEIEEPFYFTPNKIHGLFHASSGPSSYMISALLNAGYKISRSHASQGSIKTSAPRSFIFDAVREYIKTNPVRVDKIAEGSPARRMLGTEITHKVDLTPHPDAKKVEKSDSKGVRYQTNPEANWGPASRAKSVKNTNTQAVASGKRKAEAEEVGGGKRVKEDEGAKLEAEVEETADGEMETEEEAALNA